MLVWFTFLKTQLLKKLAILVKNLTHMNKKSSPQGSKKKTASRKKRSGGTVTLDRLAEMMQTGFLEMRSNFKDLEKRLTCEVRYPRGAH